MLIAKTKYKDLSDIDTSYLVSGTRHNKRSPIIYLQAIYQLQILIYIENSTSSVQEIFERSLP